jgi:peptide deformylase
MSILPVTVYGDKILKEKTKKVKNIDDRIITDIKNMFDTMRAASGVGLASNQVGLDKSIFVIDLSPVEDYEKFKPVAMINPEIIEESDETIIIEEGCLSLPNLKAEVERSEKIKVRYLDPDENEREIEADDFFARVILHEYDHLIGKMIPDRVSEDIKKKLRKELKKIMDRDVDIDYPITGK